MKECEGNPLGFKKVIREFFEYPEMFFLLGVYLLSYLLLVDLLVDCFIMVISVEKYYGLVFLPPFVLLISFPILLIYYLWRKKLISTLDDLLEAVFVILFWFDLGLLSFILLIPQFAK